MKAWEVLEDGTVWPVEVQGRSVWPGHWRVTRQDGTTALVARPNLRAADNIDIRFSSS